MSIKFLIFLSIALFVGLIFLASLAAVVIVLVILLTRKKKHTAEQTKEDTAGG
jgi:hypothetical protein